MRLSLWSKSSLRQAARSADDQGIEYLHCRAIDYDTEEQFDLIYSILVTLNPTTTSVLDMLIFPVYAASKGADHHQEAADVTGTSYRRRGVLHPAV